MPGSRSPHVPTGGGDCCICPGHGALDTRTLPCIVRGMTHTPEPTSLYVEVTDPSADIPGLAELADSQCDRTHLDGWPLLPGEGLLGPAR